jgi:hypothetical protein
VPKASPLLVLVPTLFTLTVPALALQAPTPSKPDIGGSVRKERELLANYQWRLRTEMKVDGHSRLQKVEEVHLGPDGGLVKRPVKYDKRPAPTAVPHNDPRAKLDPPATDEQDDLFAEQAQELMQLYSRLSPERLDAWAARAELMAADPDRPGRIRMHGRGLGRPLDDAVLYLDEKTKAPTEIEVKTTADAWIKDIAFLRATFEPLKTTESASQLIIPKRIFLNMNRGKRVVTLEMETSDYRSWP